MQARGMSWDDLACLIRTYQAPGRSIKIYHDERWAPLDMATVVDYSLPRRKGLVHTGYSATDWTRDSLVGNAAWHNGEIPSVGSEGTFDEHKHQFTTPNYRGYRALLEIMLMSGCLVPARTLDGLVGKDTRALVDEQWSYLRLLYAK